MCNIYSFPKAQFTCDMLGSCCNSGIMHQACFGAIHFQCKITQHLGGIENEWYANVQFCRNCRMTIAANRITLSLSLKKEQDALLGRLASHNVGCRIIFRARKPHRF